MDEYYIRIPNDFVQENKYDNETIFIYSLLQKNLSIQKQIIFNLKWLFKELNISHDSTKSRIRIRNILKKLHDDKYIIFDYDIKNIKSSDLIFAELNNDYLEDSFVKILIYEFDIIYKYNSKDIFNIFCLFACIKSRIDSKKYCYPSFSTLKASTGIKSSTSISDYLKILQKDLGLIIYDNLGYGVIDDKTEQLNNIYTMNYDGNNELLKEVIRARKDELEDYYIKIEKGISANKKRSETMKKYWIGKKLKKSL